ncbi:filamentous hemagglutinin N-terminal domain-containing protein [Yersinia kristensenii]|uniref:filamentous hemagglutinin N-terminal domain-containing protein n=2 Tax=Yersinia kristensenii TaxID=28152 RepID=UPI001C6081BA|nr:filamentous hemagglutinin N-terminal domain-containing protein [Yersinia kristensenii]MBW5815991.1 filamentous hemagglutinin N-terminal domain-containing protein [Yersinia kristensenii]MBW5841781.1 filamentous hemagglutinin N-terminal domain-containing protein [Yersinia kristensenii]
MNSKLYKLVFCRRLGCLVAVGEFTRAYGRSFSSTGGKLINDNNTKTGILSHLAILTGLALGTLPLLVLAHPSLPVNGKVIIGQGVLDVNNTSLTVTQHSDKLAINWASYDIAQGNSVIYNQPGQQSIALNRVLGRDASQIYGNLKANGQVFLLNPNGILFGKGAQVDVGGLVASTKSISDGDFVRGSYTLTSRKHEGKLVNQANLRTTAGGYIALIGQQVDNQASGVINTPQGKVALASGSRVTLNLDHGSLLGVQVKGEQVNTLLQNGGLIQADGGVIQLTARGKEMLMNTVIDNTGILQAQGLAEKNGVIYLDGGSDGVVSQKGVMDVSSPQGGGGSVILQGENIHLVAASKIDARGAKGGGKVLVGGDWQGKNKLIKNARAVVMDKGAKIDVSSSQQGAGGIAVLWSEHYTGFYGDIDARGGSLSGDGGQVETSSKRNLQAFGQVDASARVGSKGSWLLDPAEVNIVSSGAESGSSVQTGDIPAGYVKNAQVFTPTANVAQILNTSINTQLDRGTNVTVTTSNSSLTNCRWCNITVSADINKTAGGDATLTLHADGNIAVNNNISSNAGKLSLNLLAGNSTADSVITLNNGNILLNKGDLLAKHADDKSATRIIINGGRYEVGNLTLEGNTGVASQIGVNITNSANISVAGETRITGESSNVNGQGWRAIDISDNSVLTGAGNMLFTMKSNSNSSWMGTFTNATITSDKDIRFQASANNDGVSGGVDFTNGNISSKSGNISFDINGDIFSQINLGLRILDSQVSANNVNFNINVTGVDAFLFRDSNLTAIAGDINANVTTTAKGIWFSGNTNVKASGNINLQGVTSNSTTAGAEAIKINGNASNVLVNMTAGGNISLVAVNNGTEIGSTVAGDFATITAENGDFNLNVTGIKGSPINNVNISANNILLNGNISDNDAVVMTNTFLTAKNDIRTNLSSLKYKAFYFKGNGGMSAGQNISIVGNTSNPSVQAMTIIGASSNRINITVGKNISLIAQNYGNNSGAGIGIDNVNIETNNGNFTANSNGSKSIAITNTNLTANEIDFISATNIADGLIFENANITATTGNINANVSSASNKGIFIKSNSSLNAQKDINLKGETLISSEGINIEGSSNDSRNNITAQGNITIIGKNGGGNRNQATSIDLENVNLTSATKNINVNGSSTGSGNVYFNNINFNASRGNVAVYSESVTSLLAGQSGTLSLGGNSVIVANNGSFVGKALNTTQGTALIFRANSTLSVEGNIAFQGETDGTGATRKGIEFSGANTLNIAKGSQLSLLGENKGAQASAGGNGIAYTNPKQLTINNNGSLIMEGRATSGVGINFPTSNNTMILNGEGDTLIKGSSVSGSGVAISGVVNNATGPVTIEGTSTDGTGVHLFSAEHQINRINVTGTSTNAEGLRISGNATITDTALTGQSTNGIGIKVDSLPGSSVVTHAILDNATLNGSSTNGKGVELTSDINGIHHSTISGTTEGLGYGIDIAENLHVIGTSETDLLTLKGVAISDSSTGIKLNGNNDLSNTSLNGSAVDGVALDITGPLTNQGKTELNGTASGTGIGVQINGPLSGSVVNGTAASGIGVQVMNGVLDDSRINGISATGTGVGVDGSTVLNNTALIGNSTDGKGVGIAGDLTGGHDSSVQGDVVNGTGVYIDRDATLSGSASDDLLAINGNATGAKGTGVQVGSGIQLGGNNTLNNTSLNGNATSGIGISITGSLTNNGTTVLAGQVANGIGVRLDGAIKGGTVNGTSANGSGIKIDADSGLDNATLHGTSPDGKAVEITANLAGNNGSAVLGETVNGTGIHLGSTLSLTGGDADDLLSVTGIATGSNGTGVTLISSNTLDNTTLNGHATDGSGIDIDGPMTNIGNSTVVGSAGNGDGVQLNGTVSGGRVTGTSENGSGIKVDGDSRIKNTILYGNSTTGKGVEITASLSGSQRSSVQGDTVSGIGVDVAKNANLTGAGIGDLLAVSGNATGDTGKGVALDGNNILNNTTLAGNATKGPGVDIDGLLTNKGNTTVDGKATEGDGVQLNGAITGGTVKGTSDSGSGIKVDGESSLNNATLNGTSPNGKGVEVTANLSGNHGSAIHGDTTNGSGIDVGPNVALVGGGADDLLAVLGNATGDNGTGVQLDGNNILDNTTLNGNATKGAGVDIDGPLTNKGNTTVDGKATEGDGVQLNGAITDGTVNGTSDSGSGIKVDDDTQLDNATLNGNSTDGKGVEVAANLSGNHGSAIHGDTTNGSGIDVGPNVALVGGGADDLLAVLGNATGDNGTGVQLDGNNILDNTTLAGNATKGAGVDIDGPLTNKGNTTVDGKATEGDGVQLNGAITDGTVNGTSDSGSGIKVDDDTQLDNATLNGNSPDGKGVEIAGNLSGNNNSSVNGNTTNGTGVDVGENATLSGGGRSDPLTVNGNATGEKGTGVHIDGNNTLDNTTINGHSIDGHGVEITGPTTNKGNTTINGNAAGDGHGVHINGSVNGGEVNGNSSNNHGVYVDDFAAINEIAISGNTGSDKPAMFITMPGNIGENVTINGRSVNKDTIGGRVRPDPALKEKTTSEPTAQPQTGDKTGSLLKTLSQALSSLEEQQLPPAIVTESEHNIAEKISVAVCIPEGLTTQYPEYVTTKQALCDEHVLGRWKPLPWLSNRE